jgi:hypothetical protein
VILINLLASAILKLKFSSLLSWFIIILQLVVCSLINQIGSILILISLVGDLALLISEFEESILLLSSLGISFTEFWLLVRGENRLLKGIAGGEVGTLLSFLGFN